MYRKYGGNMRKFLINKAMDEEMAENIFYFLDECNSESTTDPITIIINSNGGFSFALLGMLSAIKNSEAPIIGNVYGECYSFAIPILLACDTRLASPYARFMVHEVSCAYDKRRRRLSEWNDLLADMQYMSEFYTNFITEHSKIKKDFLETIYNQKTDYYFDVNKALELGVIDEVV